MPFESQPVQGISAVLDVDEADDEYWVMPDNGYGAKDNSSDFLLRMYRIRPDFQTGRGESGKISVEEFIQLRDPEWQVPFQIFNEDTEQRLLTGADFDIESVRRDRSGDLWFGDEFGPFLLHADTTGRVLEAPFPLPGVQSPENPDLGTLGTANLPSSRGFEGTAISDDHKFLYPMLEGALENDPDQRQRFIYEFDLQEKRYTEERWQYRTEDPEHVIGALTAFEGGSGQRLLMIERDDLAGEEARFKKVYLVDLGRTDASGFLVKHEVLDLLDIQDPDHVSPSLKEEDGETGAFAFAFKDIESLLPLDEQRLLVLNDNNYPFSPHDTEAIIVRIEDLQGKP
ncbi:MAG: esterase-like activity of phytase family protein [Rubrobacteraceae bacterium]